MKALLAAGHLDVTIQRRSGIYLAVAIVTVVWTLALRALPVGIRDEVLVVAVYLDAGVAGLVFVGGQVLLERRDGALAALGVSPLTPGVYTASRIGSLTALALASTALIAAAVEVGVQIVVAAAAVVLLSAPALLCGLVVAARVRDITTYVLALQVVVAPAVVPMLAHGGWIPDLAGVLVPTDAGLQLLVLAAGGDVSGVRLIAGGLYALVATALLWRVAVRDVRARLFSGAAA